MAGKRNSSVETVMVLIHLKQLFNNFSFQQKFKCDLIEDNLNLEDNYRVFSLFFNAKLSLIGPFTLKELNKVLLTHSLSYNVGSEEKRKLAFSNQSCNDQ